jgi:hypothetical protein
MIIQHSQGYYVTERRLHRTGKKSYNAFSQAVVYELSQEIDASVSL